MKNGYQLRKVSYFWERMAVVEFLHNWEWVSVCANQIYVATDCSLGGHALSFSFESGYQFGKVKYIWGRKAVCNSICFHYTGPAISLHRAAISLHMVCNIIEQGRQYLCTKPATSLHRTCNITAQGLQYHCAGPVILLHRACNITAQGLQYRCAGPQLLACCGFA